MSENRENKDFDASVDIVRGSCPKGAANSEVKVNGLTGIVQDMGARMKVAVSRDDLPTSESDAKARLAELGCPYDKMSRKVRKKISLDTVLRRAELMNRLLGKVYVGHLGSTDERIIQWAAELSENQVKEEKAKKELKKLGFPLEEMPDKVQKHLKAATVLRRVELMERMFGEVKKSRLTWNDERIIREATGDTSKCDQSDGDPLSAVSDAKARLAELGCPYDKMSRKVRDNIAIETVLRRAELMWSLLGKVYIGYLDRSDERITKMAAEIVANKKKKVKKGQLKNGGPEVNKESSGLGGGLSMERLPLLTREEELELARCKDSGDRDAVDTFVRRNYGLVVHVAQRQSWLSGESLEDLIQVGLLSLVKIVEKYDYRRGNKFSTYAARSIERAMQRYIQDHHKNVRVPNGHYYRASQYSRFMNGFVAQHGRYPTDDEVSTHIGVATEAVRKMRQSLVDVKRGECSFDVPMYSDSARTRLDRMSSHDDVQGQYERLKAREQFLAYFREIFFSEFAEEQSNCERDWVVFLKRFGFTDDGDALSFNEIGEQHGLTGERVRQIVQDVLLFIRKRPVLLQELKDLL